MSTSSILKGVGSARLPSNTTSERSLFSALGGQDADRHTLRHSLACQYLLQPEVATKLWRKAEPEAMQPRPDAAAVVPGMRRALTHSFGAVEVQLIKGSNQYRSTVGFMDVVLYSKVLQAYERPERELWFELDNYSRIAIEVKTTPCDTGELARQLDLYQQYCVAGAYWFAAITWDMHEADKAVLKQKGISVVKLGEEFDRYCEARAKQSAITAPDDCI